jgi:hypothetical protein
MSSDLYMDELEAVTPRVGPLVHDAVSRIRRATAIQLEEKYSVKTKIMRRSQVIFELVKIQEGILELDPTLRVAAVGLIGRELGSYDFADVLKEASIPTMSEPGPHCAAFYKKLGI